MEEAVSADHPVFRSGGLSYLRIPAPDPPRPAAFYRSVFAWKVDDSRQDPSFEDGTGHVIGHFMRHLPVAGAAGITPYVYVKRIVDVLKKVTDNGGGWRCSPTPPVIA